MINFEVDLREIFGCIPKDFMLSDEEQKQEAFLEDKLAIAEETKDLAKNFEALYDNIKNGQLTAELSINTYDLLIIALQNKKIAKFCQRPELNDYWSLYFLSMSISSDDPLSRYKLVTQYPPFVQCIATKLTNYCLIAMQNKRDDKTKISKPCLAKIANLGSFACELLLAFHVLTELICSKYEWDNWDKQKFLEENTPFADRIFKIPNLHGIPGCLLASMLCCYLGYYLGPEEFYYKLANFYSELAQNEELIKKDVALIHNASLGGSARELKQELDDRVIILTQLEHRIWHLTKAPIKQKDVSDDEKQEGPLPLKNAANYPLSHEEFKKYFTEYGSSIP